MRMAHSIRVAVCENPRCRSIHLVLLDEHENPFAAALIPPEEGPDFVSTVQAALYRAAANKEDGK